MVALRPVHSKVIVASRSSDKKMMMRYHRLVQLAFHDADTDTDTDILADILARIVARVSVSVSAS